MMEAYAPGHTYELTRGEHAYFFDRWWQQRAILLWFKATLASNDDSIGTDATVDQTPLGAPASAQLVDLGAPSRAWADAQLAPYVCDSAQGVPGAN